MTVRLFLSHYPNFRQGLRGQDDTIHIKSAYFEQKVDVSFFLHSRDSTTLTSRSRSSSPMRQVFGGGSTDSLAELQKQVHAKDVRNSHLESIISQLESKYPSVQEIVRSRIEQERAVFEEKSEKVRATPVAFSQTRSFAQFTHPHPLPPRLNFFCILSFKRPLPCWSGKTKR